MEKKKIAYTPIKRVRYEYTGSLEDGLDIFKATVDHKKPFHYSPEQIVKIKSIMSRVCPAIMGTDREKPPAYSIGETLLEETGINPQSLCYIIPLLIEDGFCKVDKKTNEIKIIE